MRRTFSVALVIVFITIVSVCAQDKPGVPQPQVQTAEQKQGASETTAVVKPCLIVKHKGTVGRRLLWTALIGVPIAPGAKYDHVDEINFQNAKPTYKGKELQQFQANGVHVIVLEKNYKQENLDAARKSCREAEPQPAQPKQELKPPEKPETKPPASSNLSSRP